MTERPDDPATFYRRHVFFCVNEREPGDQRGCCAEKGSRALRDYMKDKAKRMGLKRVRINQAGCLDRCELGPSVVIYPEGVWYRCPTRRDVDEILATHVRDGGRVERLLMDKPRRGPSAANPGNFRNIPENPEKSR